MYSIPRAIESQRIGSYSRKYLAPPFSAWRMGYRKQGATARYMKKVWSVVQTECDSGLVWAEVEGRNWKQVLFC